MFRVEEVAAGSREAQRLNAALTQQLRAEQQRAEQMYAQIEALLKNEEEYKVHKVQLQHQLAELSAKAQNHTTLSLAVEKDMNELQQELKKTEVECSTAKAEVERLRRNLERRDRKLVDYDVSAIDLLVCALLNTQQDSINLLKEEKNRMVAKLDQIAKVTQFTMCALRRLMTSSDSGFS
jgi:chromosome segregation ATPase